MRKIFVLFLLAVLPIVANAVTKDEYIIGNSDYSTVWWTAFSKYYQIPEGKVWEAEFNLNINPKATNTWNNFAIIITNDEDRGSVNYNEYGAIRYDYQPTGSSEWGSYIDRSLVNSTLTFANDTDPGLEKLGGKVTLTIDRSKGGMIITMTNGVVTKTYTQNYPLDNLNANSSNTTIRAFLVPEGSYINFLGSNIEPIGGFSQEEDNSEGYVIYNEGCLTFYFDNQRSNRTGTVYYLSGGNEPPKWLEQKDVITKVVFDKSFANLRPLSTYEWFHGCQSLTAIEGIENLNTSEVWTMFSMFYDCRNLTSLDVSHFDTKNVLDMSQLFLGCSKLGSLDVSQFNTRNVCSMMNMFMECSSLTSLDVSNFDTRNVGDMAQMFSGCTSLSSLDVSHFDTKNVSSMRMMFYGCRSLTNLNLRGFDTKKVTSIGSMFGGCKKLTSLDLSSFDTGSLVDVVKSSFWTLWGMDFLFDGCDNLKSIILGSTFSSDSKLGCEYVFNDCSSLHSIAFNGDIPSSINSTFFNHVGSSESPAELLVPKVYMGNYSAKLNGNMFYGGYFNLKEFMDEEDETIQTVEGVTMTIKILDEDTKTCQVGNGAKASIDPLTAGTVTIPNEAKGYKVIGIGDYGFYECAELTTIWLPEGLEFIGEYAFYGCKKLKVIKIPEKVGKIASNAFTDCTSLTSIQMPYVPNYNEIIQSLPSTTSITISGFSGEGPVDELEEVVIPKPVTNIGQRSFSNLPSVRLMKVEEGNSVFDSRENCNAIIRTSDNILLFGCQNTKILECVLGIEAYAFEGHSKLASITFPKSIASIGEASFSGCTSLMEVVSKIEEPFAISDNTFSTETYSNAILSVPNGTKEVYSKTNGWKNFKNIVEMTSVVITFEDPAVKAICVANWDTNGDGELDEAEIAAVKDLGEVFRGNTEISSFKELEYFSGLTFIGDNAFWGCSNLKFFKIPSNVKSLGKNAFRGTQYGYDTGIIPGHIETIGDYAFEGCSLAWSTTIQEGVVSIGAYAFANNIVALSEISIPQTVVSIGEGAFSGCKSIRRIDLPGGITEIKPNTFNGTALTYVTIPSNVTSIGANAFKCDQLTSVTIETATPYAIDEDAFSNYANAVLYVPFGSKAVYAQTAGWKNFSEIVDKANNIAIAGMYYNLFSGNQKTAELTVNPKKYKGDVVIPESVEYDGITYVVTSIDEYALQGDNGYTSVTLPKTIQTVQEAAFAGYNYNYKALYISDLAAFCNIYFPEQSSTPAYCADHSDFSLYLNGEKVTDLVIPDGVTAIGRYGFTGMPLSSVTIPSSVKTVGYRAFMNCDGITTLNLSEGLESIQWGGFMGCNLSAVNLPEGLKWINGRAFMSCPITSVVIPKSVELVDQDAFRTSKLQSVIVLNPQPCKNFLGFSNAANATLYVPIGSKDVYAEADHWKDFKEIVEMGETSPITIGKSGKASYCGDKSLNFSFSDEIKAYIATGFDETEGTIWLTRVKDVPANTPVLIKGVAEKTYNVPVTDSQNSYYKNMFKGNTSGATIQINETEDGFVNYYLSGDGTFKSVKNYANIGNNKSYLQLPDTFNPATAGETQKVTVGASGKASYAAPVDLDFTNVEGLKAFTATGYDKSSKTIWLTRVMKVQKGEGLLLKGEAKDYQIPSVAVQSSYGNMFVGNTSGNEIQVKETSDDGSLTNFYLKGDGTFVSVKGYVNIKNNKCYLALPTSMVSTAASTRGEANYLLDEPEVIKMPILFRSLNNDANGTTGINVQSSVVNGQSKDAYYTLQGQRVDNPGKGIYIKNGKKVVIK